jgi:hypothetical protein
VWSQLPTETRTDDGTLVVDACGPRFLITFGPIRTIRIAPPYPSRDVVALDIEATDEATCDVDVVDLVGNVVLRRDNVRIHRGQQRVAIPSPELGSGQYIVRVRTALGTLFAELHHRALSVFSALVRCRSKKLCLRPLMININHKI